MISLNIKLFQLIRIKKSYKITDSGDIEWRSVCLPCSTGKLHGRLKSPISWLSSPSIITFAPGTGQSLSSAAGRHTSFVVGETSTMPGDKMAGTQRGLPVRWKSRRRDGCRLVPPPLKAGDIGDAEDGWRARCDGAFTMTSSATFTVYQIQMVKVKGVYF